MKDNKLDTYLAALDQLVNTSATNALLLGNIPLDQNGYLDRWHALAFEYCEDPTQYSAFIYAAYGYAVETLTNLSLNSIDSSLPQGWYVQTQVTQGMTRPDIVVFNDLKKQVAWLDITSLGSVGHIKQKAGGGWVLKDYVYEVSYPALDLSKIKKDGTMIESIKARSNLKSIEKKKELARKELVADLNNMLSEYIVEKPSETRKAFNKMYDIELSHDIIRSLIEAAGLKLEQFGYKHKAHINGRDKAGATEFLYSIYISNIKLYKD